MNAPSPRKRRDYSVLQAVVVNTATCYVLVNAFVDLRCLVADPRIRYR
jgi:ABC-type dipeptide/oligopeptide/nickel transport system permease component